jgi:hypothetical protein
MARESKRLVWSKRVVAFERSGQSRRAWCSAHGVSMGSLDAWRYRLRREAAEGLVPVVVTDAAPTAMIELSCGGTTLRLPAATEAGWLATLVRALGAPAC